MKDKILYHQANARTYLFLAKAMRSSWYFSLARKERQSARKLYNIYKQNQVGEINKYHDYNKWDRGEVTGTIILKLVA